MANAKNRIAIVVESPKKASTITAFLKKDKTQSYDVVASYGHMRDLIPKQGAIDIDNNYAMHYEALADQKKNIDAILKLAKKADQILLATDPDREGEAIAWHIAQILGDTKAEYFEKIKRVVFYQVTEKAVLEALQNPRDIQPDLVNAQQARRALDYLVGFNLSPLLWKKIRPGLSAGRVQSPALRLIVERELEIEKFVPKEYWDTHVDLEKDDITFKAKLTHFEGEKLEQFSIENEEQAKKVEKAIGSLSPKTLNISQVKKKQRKRNPAAPFTTSTLQQDAAGKLSYGTTKTMRVAQQLYEGIEINGALKGLITYMRTDSVSLASEAIDEIRQHISSQYGKPYLPAKPILYKTKSKNAQEAHEAIRPTDISLTPEKIQGALSADQFKLYDLIWKRAVASQMTPAVFDQVQVELSNLPTCQLKANGSSLHFPGFLKVYEWSSEKDNKLPILDEGETLDILNIITKQHFTEPPPRFSEASLVKTLEEYGIGRPSTYASIISTLVKREYVSLESRRFFATDVGRFVNRFLTSHFPDYIEYEFTAQLEDNLDEISRGEREWIPVLDQFWQPFSSSISHVGDHVSRQEATEEPIDEKCPQCEKQLVSKLSRSGVFIACTGYPDCKYTRNKSGEEPEELDKDCPECQSKLAYKFGRFGKFIGCTNYPECRYIEKTEPVTIDVDCPKCGEGKFVMRKSRKGTTFYACNKYPKCRNAISNEPISQKCPECDHPIMMKKVTKNQENSLFALSASIP